MGDLPAAAKDYDARAFAKFLRDMKGTKSTREFAIETDLSESFISKAVNGLQRTKPSKRTLLKLLRAWTEEPVDKMELIRVAGYKEPELEEELAAEGESNQNDRTFSTAAVITRYYGEEPFIVMGEFMKALAEHGLRGDVTSCFYREAGYFEVTDKETGQVYVGINAYVKPIRDGENREYEEDSAVFSIAFSVGLTCTKIAMSEGARDKIVYILTDNERVYDGCRRALPKNRTKATVVVLTKDHQGFCDEVVLSGAEQKPISLLD